MECGKINIFPENKQDGNRCVDCKGVLTSIGELADNSNRIMMFIKQNHLMNEDRADKFKHSLTDHLNDGIIPVEQHMKIILIDKFTGQVIKEI
jgi:signal transduction histidine kinase